MPSLLKSRRLLHRILQLAFLAAAANAAVLAVIESYDIRLGPLHLSARNLFKPQLFFTGFFTLASLTATALPAPRAGKSSGLPGKILARNPLYLASLLVLCLCLYLPSLAINFHHHDWTHRHISAGIDSASKLFSLFVTPQADGFYRPLTFISLWFDYLVFGPSLWGYHLQSIALHFFNGLMVARVAGIMGIEAVVARCAALLFVANPINFEAVIWPAARFDLLSTLFILLALEQGLKYVTSSGESWLKVPLTGALFAAGIMNKESAYSFPILLLVIALLWPTFRGIAGLKRRLLILLACCGAIVLIMIGIRFYIYHGLGGYPPASGVSPHFTLTGRTVMSPLTRVPTLPVYAINAKAQIGVLSKAGLLTMIAAAAYLVLSGSGPRRPGTIAALLGLAFVSAIPAGNLLGWIGARLQHARLLYLPSIWIAILLASLFMKTKLPAACVPALVLAYGMGAFHNIGVYRELLAKADRNAQTVSEECRALAVQDVWLVDVPGDPEGVFYFYDELEYSIQARSPALRIHRVRSPGGPEAKEFPTYSWEANRRMLVRLRASPP